MKAPVKIQVFEVASPLSQYKLDDFLAKPGIRVQQVLTRACATDSVAHHFVTIVYTEKQS